MVYRVNSLVFSLAVLLIFAPAAFAQMPEQEAPVSSISITVVESTPAQAMVTVRGTLPNPCYSIAPPVQTVQGRTISISLKLQPPSGRRMCAQVIRPFEETVAIDLVGLTPGTYTVVVNGVSAALTLGQGANIPEAPVSGVGDCPAGDRMYAAFRDWEGGFCLLYPAGYDARQTANGVIISLAGAAETRAGLTIASEPAGGRTLDDARAGLLAVHPDAAITEGEIGGQVALAAETANTRRAVVIVFDRLLTLTAQPVVAGSPGAAEVETLWEAVIESLTFFPPAPKPDPLGANATEQVFDDLGIALMLPEGWRVLRQPNLYGLISPNPSLAARAAAQDFPIALGALENLAADDFETLVTAGLARFARQGETGLTTEPALDANGRQIGVRFLGLSSFCSATLIPFGDRATIITVSPLLCDANHTITDEAAAAVLASVRLLGE